MAVSLAGALARAQAGEGSRRQREWRFSLDEGLRWSLGRGGEEPVITHAQIVLELAGAPGFALGSLEDVRRTRSDSRVGGITFVVGRRDSVEVTAEFEDGAEPRLTVRLRGLDAARDLLTVRLADGVLLAGRAAWINGYESSSPCEVVQDAGEATGCWQVALLEVVAARPRAGARPLALTFGETDGGAGEFPVAGGRIAVVSRFGHRAVGAAHPPTTASLTMLPSGDPLAQLGARAAAARATPLGDVPAGWRSRCGPCESVTEEDVLANLAAARRRFDPRFFRVILVDDGFQRSAGDWETNERFPHGHRWLTDRIHQAGFLAGLSLAPFAVTAGSGIPTAHPEWLLLGEDDAPLTLDERPHWGGRVYGLDAAQREVRDYLRNLVRHAVTEWGYDHLKLDFLHYGAMGTRPERGSSPHEALRAGLQALREGAGSAYLHGSGAPLQHALGLFDGVRIGGDVDATWSGIRSGARAALLRAHLHARAWHNDPDALVVGPPLTADEARAWASVVALSGGVTMASEQLAQLAEERLEILHMAMPVAPVRARALHLSDNRPDGNGRWNPTGERQPSWTIARVREDWWMVAVVNWDDEPRQMGANLAAAGIAGPFAAYDVWAKERRADVVGSVALTAQPHAATVLSLRRQRRFPFVLGTTRHIVQGAIDLAEERWDAGRRTLAGRSVRLDGRPYTITIAVPPGFHPRRCSARAECSVVHPHRDGRAVRLEIAGTSDDVEWEVGF